MGWVHFSPAAVPNPVGCFLPLAAEADSWRGKRCQHRQLVSILWKLFYLVNEPILEQHFNKEKCMCECVYVYTGVRGMCRHTHTMLCVWNERAVCRHSVSLSHSLCSRVELRLLGLAASPFMFKAISPTHQNVLFFSSN